MPYFALIIMYYHVKIACYQRDMWLHEDFLIKIERAIIVGSWPTDLARSWPCKISSVN